ncbi:MAG: Bax inhibitor-1/YccA family protein [Litorivicinaceae bacterium]|jgi:modulator of FtsH protease|nr:Bax inhibitor-1/YccA family protein [Litorivicinaceae bacterium]MDP5328238.1 Bax inhibitor-1/YccA family protein [Litorivicinaceae bacterium]MDP5330006.1 Bax inhibitor-1/YccA family protein [Litorivicinaceae bacterium]MDP5341508.1 Bax inhibitor-1/YccA family protein [Litorivicinaceae bacterium]MDP5363379.1 Bax inhibitor-1/YccA family protein [Litorivicinaceae bacterium]
MEPRVIQASATQGIEAQSSTNKVLRNTYWLLSLTLFFSAAMTAVAVSVNAQPMHWLLSLGGMIGLLFALQSMRNSVWALPLTFAFTGFMGWTMGPMIGYYLAAPGGASIVGNALFGTAAVFLSLSAYVITTKKDFSFLGGFLFTGLIVALLAMIGLIFFQVPALSLALSAMLAMLAAGYILFDTSRIVNGGETNYVMATVSLYVDIYLLFTNLLALFGVFSGDE